MFVKHSGDQVWSRLLSTHQLVLTTLSTFCSKLRNALPPRFSRIVRLHASGRNCHDRGNRTAAGSAICAPAIARRPPRTYDGNSGTAVLSAEHAAQHDKH